MNMVERVARAICQADEQNGGAPWDWYGTDKARSNYFDAARAAITAMRTPPFAVVKAAGESIGQPPSMIDLCYNAVIDKALEG